MIPVGGSSALGTWGYLEAAREMDGQLREAGITDVALVGWQAWVHGQGMAKSGLEHDSWPGGAVATPARVWC